MQIYSVCKQNKHQGVCNMEIKTYSILQMLFLLQFSPNEAKEESDYPSSNIVDIFEYFDDQIGFGRNATGE